MESRNRRHDDRSNRARYERSGPRYDQYDNRDDYNQDDYQAYGRSRGYERRDIEDYPERSYQSQGYGRSGDEGRSWRGPYEDDRGWRGYSANERMSGRGYREGQNLERQYQGRPGYGRGGYETGYGERGMSGSSWYEDEYGNPSYRDYNESRSRNNREGYGAQENDYDSWNFGNYGSRWESERDHYGYDSNGGNRRRGFRNW